MERYNPSKIEPKWQKYWAAEKLFEAPEPTAKQPKKYVLDMFPYPSGDGLHIGHVEGYTASDIVARFNRMRGFAVLHPMGWDAFGLPAENYALKTGIHPSITTKKNTETFKKQLHRMGFGYDWTREVNTTDPEYYKWTQWIFLQLFKAGLAYEAEVAINWCPSCKTGLANEEVVAGACDRCGSIVGKKNLRQWLLRITKYADPLLKEIEPLDWPERIKEMQRNWIGRSEGAEVEFALESGGRSITVFTTRPDTLFGATYLVLAPEHALVQQLTTAEKKSEVRAYVDAAGKKSDLERASSKKKTGVFTGAYAVNPVNDEKIPIWVAGYVVGSYGTGAIMAVPAHDERDFEFATQFKLPIKHVVAAGNADAAGRSAAKNSKPSGKEAFIGEGTLIDSGEFTGASSVDARKKITASLVKKKKGRVAIHYKLRDWVFSRQRYWGEPIPIIHCPDHGAVPVPEDQLPVKLPDVKKYEPTGTGESPLASIDAWVNTKCPIDGKPARRETNTMPQWAGSSWYFLRFADPQNKKEAWSKKSMRWLPVDFYIGGAEHAVLHLLYSRFWVKALNDAGLLPFREPFLTLRNQGIILAEDGRKMSKSFSNVINPDDEIKKYGADALRMHEMFLGPLEQEKPWSTKGIVGIVRFLERAWRLQESMGKTTADRELDMIVNATTKKVTADLESLGFNTAISSLMQFANKLAELKVVPKEAYERLILLLSPMAPHISEELWSRLGHKKSIQLETWPSYDERILKTAKVFIIIQVDGRFRARIETERGATEKAVRALAEKDPSVERALKGKTATKTIFVKDRVLNILTK
jgi:leucyl-tRNA synthetase